MALTDWEVLTILKYSGKHKNSGDERLRRKCSIACIQTNYWWGFAEGDFQRIYPYVWDNLNDRWIE